MANLVDQLVFRAKIDPASIAIQGLDGQIAFGQLAVLVKKIASKFRQVGINPGQVVVTSIPDKYLDWIITLALFHEAAVTCSNQGYSPLEAELKYDWMVTDRNMEHFAPEKTIKIDGGWLKDVQNFAYDIETIDYGSADEPARIYLTSGTTGNRKAVALTTEQIVGRARNSLQSMSPYSRFLSLLPLSTALGTNNALVCLVEGSPLYCAHSLEAMFQLVERFSIEGLHGSVKQIASLCEMCATQGKSPGSLNMVIYAGAPASPRFVENVSRYLTRHIYNDYGSTETAGISTFKQADQTHPSVCGYPFPDVTLEVVDENNIPLASGEEGVIRVRRPYMADQYYNNAEASADMFRDGWFYPGDRGRLSKDGLLFLTGRESEVINRGGVKINPALIDQFLADFPGIKDAATFGLENQAGVQDIVAAIVTTEQFDANGLKQALLRKFGPESSPSRFFRVKQIPRNQMGKVMRMQMSKAFAQHAAQRVKDA